MNTPDEIKKGLECRIAGGDGRCNLYCVSCPYFSAGYSLSAATKDALAYIQQLERERDAAVEGLKQSLSCCKYCKHDRPYHGCAKEPKLDRSCFEWHGVKEEKTNED